MNRHTYWRKQLKRIAILLAVWFVAGYVMSIFLAEPLNRIHLGGVPFGFWMAQQGAIYVFIGLILTYAVSAGRLDERAGVAEGADGADTANGADTATGKAETASQQNAGRASTS
jgi:putative solute:sodium symporter small subunit